MRIRLLLFDPALFVQASQFVVYALYSELASAATPPLRVVLLPCFSLHKYGFKRLVCRVAHHLGDGAHEVSVAGIEITAAMCQSMIMQSAPSRVTIVVLITLDVCSGIVGIMHFMEHDAGLPTHECVRAAIPILENPAIQTTESSLTNAGTRRDPFWWPLDSRIIQRHCRRCTRIAVAMSNSATTTRIAVGIDCDPTLTRMIYLSSPCLARHERSEVGVANAGQTSAKRVQPTSTSTRMI
jgi:hypothetical protein